VRPTHPKQPAAQRWWTTRADPFAHAWPVVEGALTHRNCYVGSELTMSLMSLAAPFRGGEYLDCEEDKYLATIVSFHPFKVVRSFQSFK